ncbi:insulin-like growth factor-binding protein complex acid labile subunit [Bombus pascuorum]|uniref:insulin-like growth factor-binding protein complex acid labile subunit n=1 Tax=Bombus pascuorum TaxID=65598 RepID=UPI00213B2B05|nr:insulin-like growth factor-binding protein complex acid labile subunit [Bombus pascuorum]
MVNWSSDEYVTRRRRLSSCFQNVLSVREPQYKMILFPLLWVLIVPPAIMGGYVPPGPRFRCPKEPKYVYPCVCVRGSDRGLYVRCENTNLASLSLAFSNLGNEGTPIEELVLYKCNIGRFYGPALYPLDVRVLRFIDTPLRLIEEHSFLGVNRTLQELYVINSTLEKFPRQALQILGNLSILSIVGHRISTLPVDSFADSIAAAKIEKLEISNGTLTSLPVEALTPLKKLKKLDLHDNEIKELKRNQFKGLRDTEYLDLSHNQINKLDGSHLADLTKMGWCNLSHNAISDLKRGTFARNSLLKVLNLSHNKIRKLDSNTFRGMRFLIRLYLSDNQINDVGRGTFGPVTRIGTIDLARNFIKKIDFQMFNQLQFAELLDVSENFVTVVEKLSFKDLYLAKINLSRNEISNIEPGAFENCVNITVLDLSHNKLENISRYSFDSATYATELRLSYNRFTAVNQVPLHNMTGLKVLNVSHNLIHSVPRQTFPKLYELHTIDLSHNNLSEIHNAVFQTLFSLRFLNLSYNSLEKIKPSTFGPLPTLLELDMSYNQLNDIARGSLTRLPSCRSLSVRNNRLTKIFQLPISLGSLDFSENWLEEIPTMDVWPTMNALLSLDLSGNRLGDNLKHGSFENLLTLRTLNLRSNNMTRPPWEALSTLTSLQYLYMQHNQLTGLGKSAFGRLPIVFELNLANNRISNVSTRAFEGLLQLLTLNLTNNKLTHIPNGAFQSLVSLRSLDLSHNKLERLDNKTHGLLDDCLSLERLNLSHNRISFITKKTFPNDPWIPYRLKEVDLSYNTMPVLTHELTVGTKKLQYLNISHNNINEIRRYVIGNLTAIRTLDLSYNEINDLSEPDIFDPPKNLTNLYLSHNRLTHVPLNKILPLPKLKILDVKSNSIGVFNDMFMKIIENSTKLQYTGNPLHCDCYVRPLKRWLNVHTEIPKEWSNVSCESPRFLANKLLTEVTEDLMACGQREVKEYPEFDITPDVKYRNLEYNEEDKSWKATWYVTSREDIGDFYVVVRESGSSKSAIEKDLVYSERSFKIPELQDSGTKYELCVLARDSEGNVKHFRSSQCRILAQHGLDSSTSRFTVNAFLILIAVSFATLA